MNIALLFNSADREIEPSRVKATYLREVTAGLNDAEARAYLLELIERDIAEAKEGLGRLKDAIPHADKQGVQVLGILWNARPRIKTYGYISQELEYLNGRYPDEIALNSAVKRLRRALEKTDFPIEIRNHYGIGYNLHAPANWQAPWGDE
ncbi:helix-turn-helix domain-containing protein [Roseovarius nitratireducens]|uniref:helix-turn-helix domain-containing protein n=1 Tax=Roseovarius nitratireducens TaxID=2044597 RepID=UPI000CE26F87|nr:helix-turn-helix domain-containing protein [Roseovarius nitratireducens]